MSYAIRKATEVIAAYVIAILVYLGAGALLLICATKIVKWAWGA